MGGGRMKRGGAGRADRKMAAWAGAAAILGAAMLLLWLASPPAQDGRGQDAIGGPFTLTDDRGRAVTERSFPGKFLVVYFGYAQCRDICPATLNTLSAALDRLGPRADAVQPIFVTIDPAHDTTAVLRRYVGAFSNRLIGLRGSDEELRKVADEYGVLRAQHAAPAPQGGMVPDHSAVLYLMSPTGRFLAPIPADTGEMDMAQTISRYVS